MSYPNWCDLRRGLQFRNGWPSILQETCTVRAWP